MDTELYMFNQNQNQDWIYMWPGALMSLKSYLYKLNNDLTRKLNIN